jgi:hypothetical protein
MFNGRVPMDIDTRVVVPIQNFKLPVVPFIAPVKLQAMGFSYTVGNSTKVSVGSSISCKEMHHTA